jgi:membrane-associated phospholipid phosphatase
MGTALVYLGEHYVVDLIAGAVYAAGVHFAMNAWERRRAAKLEPARTLQTAR